MPTTMERFIEAQRADGYSPNTIRARAVCIRSIARQSGVAPEDLRPDHILSYFASHVLRAWSRRTYLNHLSAFGKWLGVNLIEGIRKPPVPRSVPNPLPETDLYKLLDAAKGVCRMWVLFGAFCGLRAHETAKLDFSDFTVDEDGEVLLRVTGKGGRTDIVPVPPVVRDALSKIERRDSGPLWAGVRPERVSRTVSTLAARLGIRMRYHQLRHRFGTAVYRASGRDLLLTQRLMRHASPATTAGYAAVGDERIHDVVRALPDSVSFRPAPRDSRPTSLRRGASPRRRRRQLAGAGKSR